MKKIKLLLLTLMVAQSAYAYEYDEKDVYHILVSGTLGYAGESLLHSSQSLNDFEKVVYGAIPGIALGAIKEYGDDKYSDDGDMVLNVIGALSGSYLSNYLNNEYFFSVESKKSTKSTKVLVGYNF